MSSIDKRIKVNTIIENQLPEFVVTDFPKAAEFLKQYYISQDFQGGAGDLINNFEDSVNKISKYLDLGDFDKSQLKVLKKRTSIENMREKINNGELTYYSQTDSKKRKELLRFGKSGNWKNYFTKENEKTVDNICNNKASIILKISYYIFFTLRRKILKVE